MTTAARLQVVRTVALVLLLVRESVSIFFNKTSYIETNPIDITKQFTLSFRTCDGGQLLRQSGQDSYFELEVLPGVVDYGTKINFTVSSLALRWKTVGSPIKNVLNVGKDLDQNRPFRVVFTPKAASISATLSVSLGNETYVVNIFDTIHNVVGTNLTLGQGFIGCITFGDEFDVVNATKQEGTSEACPLQLDSGESCTPKECPPGCKGYYCEINIDDCASSPCHHASTCLDGIANYTCQCGPAWSGRNCEILNNKTLCDDNPCQNGGICSHVSNFNNYTCTCPVPFTGRNCTETLNPCGSNPCENNATCTNLRDVDFSCKCTKGFTGKRCDTNIDDCASADCGHGQCVDGTASFTCNCTDSGYTGTDCKQDVNECKDARTCQNNATCLNYAGGFLCTCVGDYQGKNCEEKIDDCAPNPCQNGGNCVDLTKDFYCQCAPGFSGKACETKLHDCNVHGCYSCNVTRCNNNGNCSCTCTPQAMYYNCSCYEGYTGMDCDQDINECMNGSVRSKICGDNGTCRNTNGSFRCECSDGFTGKLCNETEGPCNPSPCANRGLCRRMNITVNSSLDSGNSSNIRETYNCSCYQGWRGINCTEDIDECTEKIDSCNKTTSKCMNTKGSYICQCNSGYTGNGKHCTDINECNVKNPCANAGVCKNLDGDYNCFCANGFTGRNCLTEVDECKQFNGDIQCGANGRCVDKVAAFSCECYAGWMGTYCKIDIDECLLGYCHNNATCNNTRGNYTCTCQAGYTDRNCSMDIDECADSPCHNGTCIDKINDYECDCFPGYEGKSCEINIDWCSPTRNGGSVPCDYGTCQDGLLNYTCHCFDGFSGQNCSIDNDECTSSPCQNFGICVQKSNATAVKAYFGVDRIYPKNESGGYLCVCQAGYNGSNCENDIDECALYEPCNKTGVKECKDGINNYTCICNPGFTGRNCSEDIDECSSSPCQNNGTCQNLIGEYKCVCGANHTGINCENLVDPCTALLPCRNGATCHASEFNYTCACAEGYAGRQCTDRTTLGFDGTFSMTVTVPQISNNISFSFQTNLGEGVLVSQSGFWVLSLISGKLELVCAADSSKCSLGETGMFTDSNWHKAEILFDGASVSANVSKTICNVPCARSRTRRAASTELVVGADAGDTGQAKFVGSIRDFSVNNAKYYPGVSGVATKGNFNLGYQRQNVCSPDPCVNGKCKDLWTRYSCECYRYWTSVNCTQSVFWGTFGVINQLNTGYRPTSNESYASYSLSTTFQNLAFAVRTRSTSSLIIQLKFNSSVFLSVETDNNGALRLRDNNGYINSQLNAELKINNAVPHYIQINRTAIAIDNATYDVTMMLLPVKTVFVGGVPVPGDEKVDAQAQFRGCIRDVRLNGQQLLFFNQTADSLNSNQTNVARECSGEDVCANISVLGITACSGRGNCTDLWNDFQCACQFPYGGDTCELYGCEWTNPCPENGTCVNLRDSSEYECINEVTFNESQSSAYFTNSGPLSVMNSVVAQFRTRQNNTVILSSVHNATTYRYLEITVNDGYATVRYNLTENETGIVSTDTFVSDGQWHEMKIDSTAFQTNFTIFTMEPRQDKFTYLNNHSVSRNFSLLNQSFVNLLSIGGVRVGSSPINSTRAQLLGCLREMRLGRHLLTFRVENVTVQDSSSEFRLAKSAFMSANLTNVRIGCHRNNVCTGSLCGNGTCVDVWNDFHCTCPDGYHGDRCEVNPCTSSPCVSGTCAVRGSSFECACANKYTGTFCNETCTPSFCKNGGKCEISGGKLTCICESDWTGQLCEAAIPRDDDDDDDDLALIIGVAVGGGVLLLLIVAVIFVCTRQTSSTFGIYSPSSEEKAGARVEMDSVLNVPPPEKLI